MPSFIGVLMTGVLNSRMEPCRSLAAESDGRGKSLAHQEGRNDEKVNQEEVER